jgi:hypothetical protein
MATEADGNGTGGRHGATGWGAALARRRRRASELRAAIALVGTAAADLGWGAQPDVRVLPDGRLWLDEHEVAVTAAEVFQAARHLIAAQVRTVSEQGGTPVGAVAGPWLLGLHTNAAMADIDLEVDVPREDVA